MEIRDKIIESVVKKFINRSDVGYKKYGVTLHKDDQPQIHGFNIFKKN